MSSTIKLEEIVEQLTLYAIALSGKEVTLVSRDKLNPNSPENKIFLPPELTSATTRERNEFNYRMLTALQACVLRYTDERIDPKSLEPLWRYGVRKVEQDYSLETYLIDPALPPHYKENFLDVLKVIEWGRIRHVIAREYPALDKDINDYVQAECDLNDKRNQTANHPSLFQPTADLTKSLAKTISPDYLNKFVKEFNREKIDLNRALLELEYLLLISDQQIQETVKRTSSLTTTKWFDRVSPIITQENTTRSDSVRLTFEILEELVYPKDYLKKRRFTSPLDKRNSRTSTVSDDYATQLFNLRRPLLWYLNESQERLTEIKIATSEPAKDSRKFSHITYVDEWDNNTKTYQKQLCKVIEVSPTEYDKLDQSELSRFVISTEHAGEISDQLEILRPEGKKVQRKRASGDLDLNAAMQYLIDKRAGLSPEEKIYQHQEKKSRSVAHLLLVDCSGSTLNYCSKVAMEQNMRIIDMIRHGIIHYTMAATQLGDDCAILAYNSKGRNHINLYPIMSFGDSTKSLAQVTLDLFRTKPQFNNHDGAAIRYALNQYLLPHPAQTKLLIHLNDGLPSDDVEATRSEMTSWGSKIGDFVKPYVGEYAIADVRKALEECEYYGIQTCCLSFASEETRPHLERIWGRDYKILRTPFSLGKKLAQVMIEKTLI